MHPAKTWLCAKEVAEILEKDASTLYRWRRKGFGPPAYEFDKLDVKYKRDDVLAWIESRKIQAVA